MSAHLLLAGVSERKCARLTSDETETLHGSDGQDAHGRLDTKEQERHREVGARDDVLRRVSASASGRTMHGTAVAGNGVTRIGSSVGACIARLDETPKAPLATGAQ